MARFCIVFARSRWLSHFGATIVSLFALLALLAPVPVVAQGEAEPAGEAAASETAPNEAAPETPPADQPTCTVIPMPCPSGGYCMPPEEEPSTCCCLDNDEEDLGEFFSLGDSQGGFIDSAVVASQMRVRWEDGRGYNAPDRAEYLYSAPAIFGGKTPPLVGINNNLDIQSFKFYYEIAGNDFNSAFVEIAMLMHDPSSGPGLGEFQFGFGDMIAGFKSALWQNEHNLLTFQFKNHIPSGEAPKGMTTGHYSAEPGILYLHRFSSRWRFESELRDWIPVYGSINAINNPANPGFSLHNSGNVLIYGFGTSYDVIDRDDLQLASVLEFTGWHVDSGQKTVAGPTIPQSFQESANGNDIFNINVGGRITCSEKLSFYLGYGHALSDERWYNDVFRIEYRIQY